MSYYDILGVSRYASQEAIRLAYRELAKQYHPDALHKAPPKQKAEGEDAIKAINEAFEVLSNPRRRAAYHQVIWTAQDPARKHRFRAPKAADAPGEAPHTASKPNPAEKIFLQLQQLRQELELLGHHHGLKRRRLWFITAFTSIAVFMMISLGVNIYRDPGEFPVILLVFVGIELITIPIVVNASGMRSNENPLIGSPVLFSISVLAGSSISCGTIFSELTSLSAVPTPYKGVIISIALLVHLYLTTQLAKIQEKIFMEEQENLRRKITELEREVDQVLRKNRPSRGT